MPRLVDPGRSRCGRTCGPDGHAHGAPVARRGEGLSGAARGHGVLAWSRATVRETREDRDQRTTRLRRGPSGRPRRASEAVRREVPVAHAQCPPRRDPERAGDRNPLHEPRRHRPPEIGDPAGGARRLRRIDLHRRVPCPVAWRSASWPQRRRHPVLQARSRTCRDGDLPHVHATDGADRVAAGRFDHALS